MKTKVLFWSIVFVLTISAAHGASTNENDSGQAMDSDGHPGITLKDGTKLTLLGVTYGRQHMAPGFEHFATGNPINTPGEDTTVVWIEAEHAANRWPSFQLLVSDKANTACVPSEKTAGSHVKDGVDLQGFVLRAFPRWDKEMIVRIAPYLGEVPNGHFIIVNPRPALFGATTVAPLPATQSDGDFEVTLTKFVTGAISPLRRVRGVPTNDIANQCVRLAFNFTQKGQSMTNWTPRLVETSDAMGNHVRSPLYTYVQNGKMDGYFYEPGLWPDEPAWKVRMEFTRTSGFNDDEVLTLTNIPVRSGAQKDSDDQWTWEPGNTNSALADYTVNGIHLKLFPPLLLQDPEHAGQTRIRVILRPDPNPDSNGMRMALLEASDNQGHALWTPFPPSTGYNCSFEFLNARDAKAINLKLAFHKSRFVTFNVKPTRAE